MGLFTGMSVISVFEFLYWVFRPTPENRKKKKIRHTDSITPTTSRDI